MFNQVEFVREKCKEKGIPVYKLEKDLGFANGFLNPKKSRVLSSERAKLIADYLGISLYEINGQEDKKNKPDEQDLNDDELRLIAMYRELSSQGKEYIFQQMTIASQVYQKNTCSADLESSAG